MIRYILTFGLLAGWLFLTDTTAVLAQAAPPKQANALAAVHASVVKEIGAEDKTVELKTGGSILTVERVNSNMNEATHEGRNNEAKVIASLVAKGIGSEANFGNVHTIRVEYLVRSAPTGKNRMVDSVEFRKRPDGVFDFHQT